MPERTLGESLAGSFLSATLMLCVNWQDMCPQIVDMQ